MRELRWPIHPRPIAEECLISWLSRIASCYDLCVESLLQHDLGFHGDPDELNIHTPSWLLKLLSNRTGICEQAIRSMTLSSWVPFLLDDFSEKEGDFDSYVHHYSLLLPLKGRKKFLPKKPWKPWLNLQSITTILKACPVCIDGNPLGPLCLAWSLPIMLSCPMHQCLLRSCRVYQGRHIYWINDKEASLLLSPMLMSMVSAMDRRTWSALTTGQVTLPRRVVHGGVWLRLLRTVLDELTIPISSINPLHAKNLLDIWALLELKPRGGQTLWKPYESLPVNVQEQTLLAASIAIARIENGSIIPPGEQVLLFLSDPVKKEDLPSYPQKINQETGVKHESCWGKAIELLNESIELAKYDPIEAKSLRQLFLFGRTDPATLHEIDGLLCDVGIPAEFLVI